MGRADCARIVLKPTSTRFPNCCSYGLERKGVGNRFVSSASGETDQAALTPEITAWGGEN